MLRRCLVVLVLVMIAFGLHTVLHLDPSVVAMMGAGATVLVSRTEPEEFLEEVEWDTLAFFMALFVLVGALVQVGVIGAISEWAAEAMGDRELLGATALLFGSGVIGAFVDNIPYTTATVPVVEEMVADHRDLRRRQPAVVGVRLRRRPRRQRDGGRGRRQRRRARHRGQGGGADQLLGLHQVRRRGDRRDAPRGLGLRLPALLRAGVR